MKSKEKRIRSRDVDDVLELIGGRWRGAILATLCEEPKRFSELKAELKTVTPSVLIKELRYLEMNKMIYNSKSTVAGNSVVYSLTEHGHVLNRSLKFIIGQLYIERKFWAINFPNIS